LKTAIQKRNQWDVKNPEKVKEVFEEIGYVTALIEY